MSRMHFTIVAALVPIALAAAPAPAIAQEVNVPAFRSVELTGGGHVTVRHGARQSVRLVRGDADVTDFEVRRDGSDGQLVIRACRTSCRNYDLRIEIVTPDLEALAIRGGGVIEVQPGFPAEPDFALAVTGGGHLDARALGARNVAAAVRGGGHILTAPRSALAASVNGGGAIVYSGKPTLSVSIRGGGTVTRSGGR